MRPRHTILALLLVGTSVLTACGDDDTDASSSEGDADAPVKLALLWEVAGESEVAIDDYQNGAQMAVDAINAAGGIDGRQIETVRIAPPIYDLQKSTAAYLEALDEEPTAIIGFPAPAQVAGAIANVERGRVPLIATTPAGDNLRFGAESGGEFSWVMEYDGAVVDATIDYMVDELGLSKIALMGQTEDYGQEFIAFGKEALADEDLEPVTVETYEPTATDLTNQVLEVKDSGADGVMNAAFPNPLAVQLKQFRQNGVDVPTFSAGSSPIVVNYGMATGDALRDFYGVVACNLQGPETPAEKAFVADYQERYPDAGPPSYFAAFAHDAVYIVKAAIEEAGSTDPVAVNEALAGIEVTDGVACGERYEADGSHFLHRESVVVAYGPDGSSETVKRYDTPLLEEAGG